MKRTWLYVTLIVIMGTATVLTACTGRTTPTPAPTTQVPTAPPEQTLTEDDEWARVQAAGKIVVGTASDYPPFEFIDAETFELDGFDIALIKEIGKRLGVEVEIKDIVFDSLITALRLEQIDVAIAAMSVTPEREERIDFTNSYYEGTDAVLAREDSAITVIKTTGDMVGHKVGVQSGTVYETWLQDEITADDLLVYPKIAQAVNDLQDGRIDIVVMDYLPAQDYVAQGNIKLVGQDLNEQVFAMAVREGATSLKSELDRVLAELEAEGFIDQLTEEHLTHGAGE